MESDREYYGSVNASIALIGCADVLDALLREDAPQDEQGYDDQARRDKQAGTNDDPPHRMTG